VISPAELARRQLERDRRATAGFPHLLAHKMTRMRVSAHAFLRGAAPLFYDVLAVRPDLAAGPPGQGWLAGDLHLENFGAYRPAPLAGSGRHDQVEFGLNDFDEAVVGPWRLDLLRLLTSVFLAGRQHGLEGRRVTDLARALLAGYDLQRMPAAPAPIAALIETVRGRTRRQLLDARTELVRHRRRFVRGDRYRDLPRALADAARAAFGNWVSRLSVASTAPAEAFEIVDVAFRVAGTGSLGVLRVAVLTQGKGGPHSGWIFDLKEERAPAAARLLRPPPLEHAVRVKNAMLASLAHPPTMLGTTRLGGRSMLVRRLAPQEDKLDVTRLSSAELVPVARYLGALVGAAHRRGATLARSRRLSADDISRLLAQAVELCGIHEAAYLAWSGTLRS
jgi:uncharacterized protein (DUF2252 family)